MFSKLRIRHKLLISYSLVLILSLSMGSTFIYFFVRNQLTAALEAQLNSTTRAILDMIRTSVAVSIKNHLRAVAEKNIDIIRYYHAQQQAGRLSEARAKVQAAQLMLAQKIGASGYIYCIDSAGTVTVHPQPSLLGTNVSAFAFVREQTARRKGYIEYDWKNPGQTDARPKALYMLYFAPWDWIVSVSSYRDEFVSLVDVPDFEKTVHDLRFGKTGYAFVIDGAGKAIIHPQAKENPDFGQGELPAGLLREMQRRKSGKIVYPWKDPDGAVTRSELVMFDHIPELGWTVAACSHLDEQQAPMRTIRTMIIGTAALTFLLLLPLSFRISASITRPLKRLIGHFNRMMAGDFSSRMVPTAEDEIGQLGSYYNRFADQIEAYRDDLEQQMSQRRQFEEALKESEARYRSVMEAAPDPIVVYDMKGLVMYFNPAFTRVFGFSLDASLGRKMDHFVPEENWDETHRMISTMLAGETLSSVPTRRYTRTGSIVDVSISGATFRNRKGELDGSVIILRDVTQPHRLQQQVMEIGDQVRRRIGQDLHDDLCPHLIGIHGLSTVLAANIREAGSRDLDLACKVVDLIHSAIEKARTLSRGLCPVHLVAHGFIAALEDIAQQTETAFNIACRFDGDDRVDVADNTVATHLYYIVQEAVQNAVKHAHASRIDIHLAEEGGRLHLQIVDDGDGLPARMESQGIGLQIMQYRAKIIYATFQIDSHRHAGTAIHVFLKTAPAENP